MDAEDLYQSIMPGAEGHELQYLDLLRNEEDTSRPGPSKRRKTFSLLPANFTCNTSTPPQPHDVGWYFVSRLQQGLFYITQVEKHHTTPRKAMFLKMYKEAYKAALENAYRAPLEDRLRSGLHELAVQAYDRAHLCLAFPQRSSEAEVKLQDFLLEVARVERFANYGEVTGNSSEKVGLMMEEVSGNSVEDGDEGDEGDEDDSEDDDNNEE